MQTNGDETEAFQAKPAAKYDLKSWPLQDLEKKLESSPVGLSQAEAAKWLADIVLADARAGRGSERSGSVGVDGRVVWMPQGTPQVILKLSANAAQVKADVEKAVNEFAARGFRSLGVARANQESQWQFLGVLPLFDPPREQAKATIAAARQMGVDVKMVTGDALTIARETASKLGLGTNIVDASGFGDTKHHETEQLAESIEDAIKESRKICQRINSYAIYHIAETIRVLLLMTLSILTFNFFPVTAVMIVMLALLNDGAILSIAYDRVHYKDKPESWNMRMVLGIATVLGLTGVVASLGKKNQINYTQRFQVALGTLSM